MCGEDRDVPEDGGEHRVAQQGLDVRGQRSRHSGTVSDQGPPVGPPVRAHAQQHDQRGRVRVVVAVGVPLEDLAGGGEDQQTVLVLHALAVVDGLDSVDPSRLQRVTADRRPGGNHRPETAGEFEECCVAARGRIGDDHGAWGSSQRLTQLAHQGLRIGLWQTSERDAG